MEHILQFAIAIDDDTIVKRIEENAEKSITKDLRDKVGKIMFGTNAYTGREREALCRWAEELFLKYLEDHKAEIIEIAADHLADKLARKKAVLEAARSVAEAECGGKK